MMEPTWIDADNFDIAQGTAFRRFPTRDRCPGVPTPATRS